MNDLLLLVRLWASDAAGATLAALHKDLDPIVARARATGPRDAATLVTRALDDAIAEGLVVQDFGKRTTKVLLTAAGRARAQAAIPGTTAKTSFAALKKTWLPAHALGLASTIAPVQVAQLSRVTTLRLVLLNHHFGLGLPVVPSAKDLDAALAWHAMRTGLSDAVHQWAHHRPLTIELVLSALVASLGDVAPAPKKHDVYARLAAKIVGARNASDLHDALVARLAMVTANVSSPPSRDFAADVLAAATRSPTGKLDASLILINHAHRQYVADHPDDALSLDAFKERLWAVALAGRLMLASADMPQTLDPDDYRASRIERGASIYALIRI